MYSNKKSVYTTVVYTAEVGMYTTVVNATKKSVYARQDLVVILIHNLHGGVVTTQRSFDTAV